MKLNKLDKHRNLSMWKNTAFFYYSGVNETKILSSAPAQCYYVLCDWQEMEIKETQNPDLRRRFEAVLDELYAEKSDYMAEIQRLENMWTHASTVSLSMSAAIIDDKLSEMVTAGYDRTLSKWCDTHNK